MNDFTITRQAGNRKALAPSRQRLGVRWPSTAFAIACNSSQSARGLAQSKTWRLFDKGQRNTDWLAALDILHASHFI